MADLILNVWAVPISERNEVFSLKVNSELKISNVKNLVAEELGWPSSGFNLYTPSRSIKLPERFTQEVIDEYMLSPLNSLASNALPDLQLVNLPRNWVAEEELADNEAIHFVAFQRGNRSVNVYNMKSRKIDKFDIPITQYIGSFCEYAYKPPTPLAFNSPSTRRAAKLVLAALESSRLEEVPTDLGLLDLYPLGLPAIIHLINAPPDDDDDDDDDDDKEEEDVLGPLNVTAFRRKFLKSVPPKAPSSEAKGAALTSQTNQQLIGRRLKPIDAAPPSLFDETLCQLRYDVSYGCPSQDDFEVFDELRCAMTDTYRDESSRKSVFHHIASKFLPAVPRGISISEYHTDGALDLDHDKRSFIYVLVEVKNEIGLAVSEPGVQAGRYYLEHCRGHFENKENALAHFCFPVILLCQYGAHLSVFVGSSGGQQPRPVAEHIACITFQNDPRFVKDTVNGARIIGAVRVASLALREKYPALLEDLDHQVRFPYPRFFTENGRRVRFTYIRAEEDKRLYYAEREDTNAAICVKFSQRYSSEAHLAAYDAEYAPKLLACESVGDWQMIVMDDKSTDYMTFQAYKAELNRPDGMVEKMLEEVGKALESLHGKGFVHGDVRAVNTLVRKKAKLEMGPGSVLLVDWDWAGREGEVCYPTKINPELARHPDAKAGGAIEREHDLWMLRCF